MTTEFFHGQIARLKETFGEKTFGNERLKLIFLAVKKVPEGRFEAMVNHFIGNNRYPPLLKEFVAEVEDFEKRKLTDLPVRCSGGELAILALAAQHADNREFAAKCTESLQRKVKGEYTREQFLQACDYLDAAAKISCGACEDCNDCGYAMRFEGTYQVLYRCGCKVGRNRPRTAFGPMGVDGKRTETQLVDAPYEESEA